MVAKIRPIMSSTYITLGSRTASPTDGCKNKTDHELNLHHFRFSDGLPQFSYRLTRQYNQKSTAFLGMYGVGLSLLLSAPAFSGGDFCVNHLIA